MLSTLHRAGHKYLKLLFVAALAGSSTLFFIGVIGHYSVLLKREVSRLSSINTKTAGLRVAIPRRIIEELSLKFQDLVEWEVSKKGDENVACIRKLD